MVTSGRGCATKPPFSEVLPRRARNFHAEAMTHAFKKPLSALPSGPLRGRIAIPGDKSISHRSLMFGALAEGETKISGLLESEDVMATASAMRAYGATVEKGRDAVWHVGGLGTGGLKEPEGAIDFGNAGTGVRLTIGIAGAHPFASTFVGDPSLSKRPMGRVLDPLRKMGAEVIARAGDRLPLSIKAGTKMTPIEYRVPVPVRAGEVGCAACRAQHRWRDDRDRAGRDTRPHRADAEGLWRRHLDRRKCLTARRRSVWSAARR